MAQTLILTWPNTTYINSITLTPIPSWLGGSLNSVPWTYSSTGTYTNSLTVGNTTGFVIIGATINGVTLTSLIDNLTLTPNVTIDPAMSTISAVTNPLTADGLSTSTVIVTLRNSIGQSVNQSGHTVVVSASVGTLIGSMAFHSATGTYRQVLRAPSSVGVGTVTVSLSSIDGTGVGGITTVITLVAGSLSLTNSTFSVPNRTFSAFGAPGAQTSTVTLRDTNNNFLNLTGATVTITTQNISGTFTGASSHTAGVKQSAGVYTSTATPPAGCTVSPCTEYLIATVTHASINAGVATEVARIKVQYNNAALTPAAAQSTLTASTTTDAAGVGASTITLTVQLKTAASANLNVGGHGANLAVSTTLATTPSSIVDNDNGTYTISIPSPGTSQTGTVTVTYSGTNVSSSPITLTFFGEVSPANSIIVLSSSAINGTGSITATLKARDSNNFAIPLVNLALADIQFTHDGLGSFTGVISSSVVTSQAQYTQTYTRTAAPTVTFETVTIGASVRIAGIWVPVSSTLPLTITPLNLAGVTINCSNVATYRNTHLYVNGGTLTINTWYNGAIPTTGDCTGFDASVNNHPFVFASLTVGPSGIVTHTAQDTTTFEYYGLDIEITGSTSIQAGGKIDVSEKGFVGGTLTMTARTGGNALISGTCTAHSSATVACESSIYGNHLDPSTPGSGGYYTTTPGGNGGGVMRLKTGTISVMGNIASNGGPSSNASGAGGSIKIVVTGGALAGSGLITSNVGAIGSTNSGGRIYINASSITFPLNNIQSKSSGAGGFVHGSIYIVGALTGSHTLNHSLNLGINTGTYSGVNRLDFTTNTSLTIPNGVTLTVDSATSLNSLAIQSGGIITHNLVTSSNLTPAVNLTITNLFDLQVGGSINVEGKGFPGANRHSLTPVYCGVGPSNVVTGAGFACVVNLINTESHRGGNHYAAGGRNTTGILWGDINNPNTYGGGAIGESSIRNGGAGGGIIRVAADSMIINGGLQSNGSIHTAALYGLSAGGSIKLTATTSITSTNVTAYVRANGADVTFNGQPLGAGSGGLIFIQGSGATALTIPIEARGGLVFPVAPTGGQAAGGAGSVIVSE